MQSEPESWQRVADAVKARRARRGWTQIDVATNGPLSLDRVQAIESAKRTGYRLATIIALERALEWAEGSVRAILDGGEPTPLEQPAAEPERPEREPTVAELAAELAAVRQQNDEITRRNAEIERRLAELEGRRKPNQAAG